MDATADAAATTARANSVEADAGEGRDAGAAFTCAARMEGARTELLAAHLEPAKDTERWLQLTGLTDGGLLLSVYTVYTPDGDGYRVFAAEIHPFRGQSFAWHLCEENLLDEFKEERLPERTWTSARAGWIAKIHDGSAIRGSERAVARRVACGPRATSRASEKCRSTRPSARARIAGEPSSATCTSFMVSDVSSCVIPDPVAPSDAGVARDLTAPPGQRRLVVR
jgi:hypothetical protein